MHIVKMPDEQKQCGQQGFVAVGNQGKVDDISRQKSGNYFLLPHNNTGGYHDDDAPEGCPVVKLFFPGKLGAGGPFSGQKQVIIKKIDKILDILETRHEGMGHQG